MGPVQVARLYPLGQFVFARRSGRFPVDGQIVTVGGKPFHLQFIAVQVVEHGRELEGRLGTPVDRHRQRIVQAVEAQRALVNLEVRYAAILGLRHFNAVCGNIHFDAAKPARAHAGP